LTLVALVGGAVLVGGSVPLFSMVVPLLFSLVISFLIRISVVCRGGLSCFWCGFNCRV